MPLNFGARIHSRVPQNWGASAVLGSPQVEQLAWMRGGIPGFRSTEIWDELLLRQRQTIRQLNFTATLKANPHFYNVF